MASRGSGVAATALVLTGIDWPCASALATAYRIGGGDAGSCFCAASIRACKVEARPSLNTADALVDNSAIGPRIFSIT